MNAQIQQQNQQQAGDEAADLRSAIRSALTGLVSDLSGTRSASRDAGAKRANAAAHLRQFVGATQEAGIAVEKAQELLRAAWKATTLPVGTIKPYVTAYAGYRAAMDEGVNIFDLGGGKDGNPAPLSVPKAREYLIPADQREANKAMADVRAEIAERVRGVKNLADLVAFRDMLPEVEGGTTTTTEPTADDLLAAILGKDDGAQPARRASVH